jgi:2-polyprenyl-6-methoxyphenol hydroxylase-like FAD-dependent oxidoreductase
MLGAYTLAGELALADGDYQAAFQRYERFMRPKVAKSQKTAAGAADFLTPATAAKIRNRDLLFRFLSTRAMAGVFGFVSKRTANTGALRDYPLPRAAEVA